MLQINIVTYLLKAKRAEPEKMSTARQCLCKHISTATKSRDCNSRYICNMQDVLYWAHIRAISRELKPIVGQASYELEVTANLWQWVAAGGGQAWLGVSDLELQLWGAVRQSVATKDMNTEAEGSAVLGTVTKQRQVKTKWEHLVYSNCKVRKWAKLL
jgi:hypothetical protein